MISTVLDVLGVVLLIIGLLLLTISVIGVLRLPDTNSQLHAQGLATGPGVIAVLASSIGTENATIITFAVLGIAFMVLSSPSSGHAIAKTVRRRNGDGRDAPEYPSEPE